MFEFKIIVKSKNSRARVGEFQIPHGKLLTPELAFVATEGEIKAIPKEILPKLPVNLIIVNTFHLWVKNIVDRFSQSQLLHLKGDRDITMTIHNYANSQKPIMSDSGGFQVFSLGFSKVHRVGKIAKIFPGEKIQADDKNNPLGITDEGVTFTYNDQKVILTPELSIQLQQQIGADIIFAFDECTSPLNSHTYTKKAMERTHRWLERCLKENQNYNLKFKHAMGVEKKGFLTARRSGDIHRLSSTGGNEFETGSIANQALFAVVQGGYFEDLRKKSAKFMGKQNVPGFGIGGTLGRSKVDMHKVIDWMIPYLPEEKPRHLLGIGQVRDIFEAVERGVDLFDCVIPTREARHKVLYTKHGRINIKKFRNVNEVLEKGCFCLACKEKLTYRQLIQLFQLHDPRAFFFATVHNIQFYADLMRKIREAIDLKKFSDLKEKIFKSY